MHICLLVTTRNRTALLERFLESLIAQRYRDFSLLLGDQNPPGVLDALLARYAGAFPIQVVPLAPCGLSEARNALLPLAKGDFIALADDDCHYADDTLEQLQRYSEAAPDAGAVVGTGFSQPVASAGHLKPARSLSRYGVFNRAPSWCIFIRGDVARQVGGFDVNMGLGAPTPWKSGEETDYLVRVLNAGYKVYRGPSIHVFHDAMGMSKEDMPKIYSYGMGRMYLLFKHNFPIWFSLANIVHPFFRILAALPYSGFRDAGARLATVRGRFNGFFAVRARRGPE